VVVTKNVERTIEEPQDVYRAVMDVFG